VTTAFRTVQITDPHLHAHKDARMRGVNTCNSLEAVLSRLTDGKRSPDAIVATGDLVQDETRGGYLRFERMLKPLNTPVYCIPGNHDEPVLMQEILNAPPFQYCGEADFGAWRAFFLNSHASNDDGGQLTTEQLEDLDQGLSNCEDRHAIIYLHHHPIDMGSRWLDGVGLRHNRDLLKLVFQHRHVKAVVWGHVHQASDHFRDGVRFLSTPSTCSQFLPNSDDFALDTRPPGYRWIDLYEDGTLDTDVVWVK